MEIKTQGLHLELTPHSHADDEDWAHVNVMASVNGFRGEFVAWIQTEDLTSFADQCKTLHEAVGHQLKGEAVINCAEPGIMLRLMMNERGHIKGEYALESERREGDPTVLTGTFETDQAYLPELARQARNLAKQLRERT